VIIIRLLLELYVIVCQLNPFLSARCVQLFFKNESEFEGDPLFGEQVIILPIFAWSTIAANRFVSISLVSRGSGVV